MSNLSTRRRIGVLTFPQLRELDFAAVVDVFVSANRILPEERRYEIDYVCTEDAEYVTGSHGIRMQAGVHFKKSRGDFDTFLIGGGESAHIFQPRAEVLAWLRRIDPQTRRMGAVCGGSFLLAASGLIDGRRATTHWAFAAEMARAYPKVKVDAEPIWIRDGKYYSSAGVTSAIDLCLALVEEDHGRKVALDVARMLVVFLCRPGSQAQFSVSLREQTTENRPLKDLQIWMLEHLAGDLSVPALAARVAMSDRNFQRVFTRELGKAPAHYVEEIRVEAVRRKLERSTQSMEEIAAACGFGSADVMGRSFQRQLKCTPAEYRGRFRTTLAAQQSAPKKKAATKTKPVKPAESTKSAKRTAAVALA